MLNIEQDQLLCENAKQLLFGKDCTEEDRSLGVSLLLQAMQQGNLEARFILGRLLLEKKASVAGKENPQMGISFLCYAARAGYAPACAYLNRYYDSRYESAVGSQFEEKAPKPLVDFNGKRIKLRRTGARTPVDATLTFENGENVLTLSTNIAFVDGEDVIENPEAFYRTVVEGIQAWSGEYEVFGGQRLRVVVNVTQDERVYDNLYVVPMTDSFNELLLSMLEKFKLTKRFEAAKRFIREKRSAASMGLFRWSVHSRKIIYIHSQSGAFNEYDEIRHVVKHEFGHALGLGDLYKSLADDLQGVKVGQYREIDSYAKGDSDYYLVMCDHHGPVSNNDIEMVVLAFSKNCLQRYQPNKLRKRLSPALGKGN